MFGKILYTGLILAAAFTVQAEDCSHTCSASCVRQAQQTKAIAQNYLEACGATPDPGNGGGGSVSLYKSDRCDDDLVAVLNSNSDCRSFANTRVWGVMVNGQCQDIRDVSGDVACEAFRAGSSRRAVGLYKSDKCDDDMVAYIDRKSDCEQMARKINSRVWGVTIDGQCQDIADTDFVTACRSFGGN